MSSAVPIHPLIRLIRQHHNVTVVRNMRSSERAINSAQVIRHSSTRTRSQANKSASVTAAAAPSSMPSAAGSSSQTSSAAARAYAMTSKKGAEAQAEVKVNDKRTSKASQQADKGTEADRTTGEDAKTIGEAQKMLGEDAARSSKKEASPPLEGEMTKRADRMKGKQAASPAPAPSADRLHSANGKEEVLTDGVIVSKSGSSRDQESSRAFPFTSPEAQNSKTESADNRVGVPSSSSQESNEQIRRHLILYPFNTHDFIKRLQCAGFLSGTTVDSSVQTPSEGTSLTANKRHDPAEAIMDALQRFLVMRGQHVVDNNVNKVEVENQAYLFTAALAELRTELQVMARNDAAALRSMVTLLQREVDGLNQRMREDVAGMKHDIQVDMNNRKSEAKEEQNALDQEIQDLNNRFTISISDLKTEIEQSIKWDATRRALTIFFGCIVIVIATLTAADYLTRDEVEHASISGKAGTAIRQEPKEPKTKSAEELGLVANYDEEHHTRYV